MQVNRASSGITVVRPRRRSTAITRLCCGYGSRRSILVQFRRLRLQEEFEFLAEGEISRPCASINVLALFASLLLKEWSNWAFPAGAVLDELELRMLTRGLGSIYLEDKNVIDAIVEWI